MQQGFSAVERLLNPARVAIAGAETQQAAAADCDMRGRGRRSTRLSCEAPINTRLGLGAIDCRVAQNATRVSVSFWHE